MSELNKIRLNKVLREFNISLERVVEFLSSKGHNIEARPTTKISQIQYDLLLKLCVFLCLNFLTFELLHLLTLQTVHKCRIYLYVILVYSFFSLCKNYVSVIFCLTVNYHTFIRFTYCVNA